ncbi:MAG: hypothetical protein OEZ34_17405 [Spirochaetia bacterium]|nr:hypothetical protein [Spirochaetia bacterium]
MNLSSRSPTPPIKIPPKSRVNKRFSIALSLDINSKRKVEKGSIKLIPPPLEVIVEWDDLPHGVSGRKLWYLFKKPDIKKEETNPARIRRILNKFIGKFGARLFSNKVNCFTQKT